MLIWFRIKALYVGAIAFGISFVWAMIAFGIFSSSISEDALAALMSPMWIFILGLSVLLVDLHWHLSDPNAVMFFALFSMKTWSIILMILGIWASVVAFRQYGFNLNIILFTLASAAVLIGIYLLLKKGIQSRHPKTQ